MHRTSRSSISKAIAASSLGLLISVFGFPLRATADSSPLAFPGAEGAGRHSVGGRGGRVIEVTSLADSGPGSLRAALSASGRRTVVFRIGGTIEAATPLVIREPYVTVAGQTAPGDGVTLKGTLLVEADHVIVRHLRCRAVKDDALSISRARDVIVDHCSASWGDDEVLSVTGSPDRVTVQWSIISESLNHAGHGYASLIRGSAGATVTFHHNLFAHHAGRSPRPGNYKVHTDDPKGLIFDFRNNVVYNWGGRYAGYNADGIEQSITRMNFVGNYYRSGPDSFAGMAFRESATYGEAWFADNMMDGTLSEDPWSLVGFRGFGGTQLRRYKRAAPIPTPPVETEGAKSAFLRVLAHAGASKPQRDVVDRRIVANVRSRGGRIIERQGDVGGWPSYAVTTTDVRDFDQDGMADLWEREHGLNPEDPSDGPIDADGDGLTNLEDYLAELAGP